jgi:hypothetical protein
VVIDLDGDGGPDMILSAFDLGFLFDSLWGITGAIAFDANTGDISSIGFARLGTHGSTVLLPVLASDLGLRPGGDTDFRWWNEAYSGDGVASDLMTTGSTTGAELPWFDAFHPALSSGAFKGLRAGATASVPLRLDRARYAPVQRGQLGWMVVSLDDPNGRSQADLVPVGRTPR